MNNRASKGTDRCGRLADADRHDSERNLFVGSILMSQRNRIRMIYSEEKTQEEVARHFRITKSAVSHAMEQTYERM